MKAREEIASVLKQMRTFTISDVVRETWDISKAQVNWEATVRSYVRTSEKRGHVRKIDKVKRNFYTKTLQKQERSSHGVFLKGVAFGFPYHLCKFLHSEPGYGLKALEVLFQGRLYRVSAEKFFREGYFLNFKSKGIELRMFLELSKWEVVE